MGVLETVQEVLATAISDGLEEGFRLFVGLYRAKVVDNKDPKELGRIQVTITDFGHSTKTNKWITPIFGMAGPDRGAFYPPEIGDMVRVVFFHGDPDRPLAYFPGWYLKDALPSEFVHGDDHTPYVRGYVSRGGHSILFSDEPDKQFVQLMWHKPASGDASLSDTSKTADRTPGQGQMSWFRFTDDGGFQLALNSGEAIMSYIPVDGAGQFQILDSYGNNITMDDEGVKIQDTENNMIGMYGGNINIIAGKNINITGKDLNLGTGGVALGSPAVFSAVLGELLLTYLAAHTHSGVTTGPGVSGPPIPPPPPALLSKSVKLKV